MNEQVKNILKEIEDDNIFFHELFDSNDVDLSDEYKKINYAYFRIIAGHYEAFINLIYSGHFSSGILLLRTMLELYVKSYYLEFIAKNNNDSVLDYINDTKKFPDFFTMVKNLENYKNESEAGFDGFFEQFTKNNLASYEKFSLFSHGKGEFLKGFYRHHDKMIYSTEQITDVLQTAKGLFETLGILLFFVQNKNNKLKLLLDNIQSKKT